MQTEVKAAEHTKVDVKPAEQAQVEVESAAQKPESDDKLTICHLTGNGSFVEITVDRHALKHGHTVAMGDIIPAPAGGCGAVAAAQTEQASTCVATETKRDEKSNDEHGKSDVNGKADDDQASKPSEDNDADEATECEAASTSATSVQSESQAAAAVAPAEQAPAQQASAAT